MSHTLAHRVQEKEERDRQAATGERPTPAPSTAPSTAAPTPAPGVSTLAERVSQKEQGEPQVVQQPTAPPAPPISLTPEQIQAMRRIELMGRAPEDSGIPPMALPPGVAPIERITDPEFHLTTPTRMPFMALFDVPGETGAELFAQVPKIATGRFGEVEAPTAFTGGLYDLAGAREATEQFQDRPMWQQLALGAAFDPLGPPIGVGAVGTGLGALRRLGTKAVLRGTVKVAPETFTRAAREEVDSLTRQLQGHRLETEQIQREIDMYAAQTTKESLDPDVIRRMMDRQKAITERIKPLRKQLDELYRTAEKQGLPVSARRELRDLEAEIREQVQQSFDARVIGNEPSGRFRLRPEPAPRRPGVRREELGDWRAAWEGARRPGQYQSFPVRSRLGGQPVQPSIVPEVAGEVAPRPPVGVPTGRRIFEERRTPQLMTRPGVVVEPVPERLGQVARRSMAQVDADIARYESLVATDFRGDTPAGARRHAAKRVEYEQRLNALHTERLRLLGPRGMAAIPTPPGAVPSPATAPEPGAGQYAQAGTPEVVDGVITTGPFAGRPSTILPGIPDAVLDTRATSNTFVLLSDDDLLRVYRHGPGEATPEFPFEMLQKSRAYDELKARGIAPDIGLGTPSPVPTPPAPAVPSLPPGMRRRVTGAYGIRPTPAGEPRPSLIETVPGVPELTSAGIVARPKPRPSNVPLTGDTAREAALLEDQVAAYGINQASEVSDVSRALDEGDAVAERLAGGAPPRPRKPGQAVGADMPPPERSEWALQDELETLSWEKMEEAVLRKWSGARNVQGIRMTKFMEEGNRLLKRYGLKSDAETMEPLFEVLHGERALSELSDDMQRVHDYVIELRNLEEREMLEFLAQAGDDPALRGIMAMDVNLLANKMMAHPDYFPRN